MEVESPVISEDDLDIQPPRKKSSSSDYLWKITVNSPVQLKKLVSLVQKVLSRCNFRLSYNDNGWSGICIDCISSDFTCAVFARFECTIDIHDPTYKNDWFSLKTNKLIPLLRDCKSEHVIMMYRFSDRSNIWIRTFDEHCRSSMYLTESSIECQEEHQQEPFHLTNIQSDLQVDISLINLKKILKNAKDLSCDSINITVDEQTFCTDKYAKYTHDGINKFVVRFNYGSEGVNRSCLYHSSLITTSEEDNETIALTPGSIGEPESFGSQTNETNIYNETFPLENIFVLLKNMDQPYVSLSLSAGKPLIMTFQMGGNSNIKIAISQQSNGVS